MLKVLFGRRLKQLRESKGLTQQGLAELLDMQTNSIGLIETGSRAVSFETIEKLADKLNVNYYELFDFSFEPEISKEKLLKDINIEIASYDRKILKHLLEYSKMIKNLCEKKKEKLIIFLKTFYQLKSRFSFCVIQFLECLYCQK